MTSLDLTGKVAFVTGGTRGIGFAIAGKLGESGARIAISGRDEGRAAEAASRLGGNVMGVACDVADEAQVEQAVAAIEGGLGPVDILVNNAGITRDNILLRLDGAAWDEVLDTNLKGAFHTTRAVIKGMMKRRRGRIINISSIVGLTGNKGQANYAASKAGLIGFTKAVAREYASRGITANCVAPGYIETDMTNALPEDARKALLDSIVLGRLGQPEDIAGAVLYLASDLAAYVTGQVLVVDGGMTM